jgi:hypothetical protein
MSDLSGARRPKRLLTARLIAAEQAAAPLRNVSRETIIARIEWMLYGDDLDRTPQAAVFERHHSVRASREHRMWTCHNR